MFAAAALSLVLLGTRAAPCAAQLLPLSASAASLAAPGSFVWRTLAWRNQATLTLRESPLGALADDRPLVLASEWAPLYHGADGTRVEQARQLARFTAPAGPLRLGAELTQEAGTFRGGQSSWGIDAAGTPLRDGSLGLAWLRPAGAMAIGASVSPEGRLSFAFEGGAAVARTWRSTLAISDVPQAGSLDARYEDQTVAARGVWSERRAAMGLTGPLGGGELKLTLESLDHLPRPSLAGRDDLASRLAWRETRLEYATEVRGIRIAAELGQGAGRQRIEVRRNGAPYAVAAGPVREQAFVVRLGPAKARWTARAFAGATHASASGSLALWPFDGLAAVTGTRLAVRTTLDLRHRGLALDSAPAPQRGWDAGVAAWVLEPHGDYETWRGTLFGLGRDDDRRAAFTLDRTLLAGVRVARTQPLAGVRLRIEIVQWIPLAWSRTAVAAPAPESPAPVTGTSESPARERAWGGTLVRLSL